MFTHKYLCKYSQIPANINEIGRNKRECNNGFNFANTNIDRQFT